MITPKNQKEGLLFSITKKCGTFIKQTHTRHEEKLEFKVNQPKETFHLNPPFEIKGDWMIGLISLVVYNSFFNINTTNKTFEIYTVNLDEFSFEEVKDELEEILCISDITPYHLQHGKFGPRNIEADTKLIVEKSSTDGCHIL